MFAVTPRMEPVERDAATQAEASIAIEFVVLYFIFDEHRIKCTVIMCNWEHKAFWWGHITDRKPK